VCGQCRLPFGERVGVQRLRPGEQVRSWFYPRPAVDTAGSKIVSQAGAALLIDTVGAVGLDKHLSTALARWRHPNARHDPPRSCSTSR
jgi:hypothetical protein